jgi:hypothetical protein
VVAIVAVVAALAAVIWSGATRQRHLHYTLVAVFFLALGVAVWRAELVGRGLLFDGVAATVHRVHDVVVVIDFVLALALVVTGVRLARAAGEAEPARRRVHRSLAFAFTTLVLVSAALGTAMTLLARPAG